MKLLNYIFALLLFLCTSVCANTEIRHFRLDDADSDLYPTQEIQALVAKKLTASKLLAGPYEKTEIESIYAVESKKYDSKYKEKWYQLSNIQPGCSYELRISYAASMPSNFEITLYTVSQVARIFNIIQDKATMDAQESKQQGRKIIMYAKVTSSYVGISHIPGMEDQAVPYILVLEKHVLGLPVQALKLVGVLVIVIAISLLVVTPRILAKIDNVLAESPPYKEE
ncbi:hypothetical protein COEREDRAFT_79785 [Coemansia reversa NRRL 1564]|uniref:ER membrane protein complex subunit 7 beta-sandwich domain-containing protein n=1 Tax=Coemansia reversa (strain ATCC 12441 / NRRL 1564) TaxID=763665 RepID=A0A2G5BGX8_COERN|nr:hypothetical protein COEREDRAFT_79785 [Coemansia reversa NRRL 1564]|eukprot:PIA18278.1 hypothetical protein COEREDRAFT_79785 [Coemansia reversa NRRL 1564]